METMGQRIRLLRRAKGWSQQALGDRVGVTREAVSQWELGSTQNIKLKTFLRLIEELGTTHEYLVHGPDERLRAGSLRKRPPASGNGNSA